MEVEVRELGVEEFGSFVAGIPAPLGIGKVALDDGSELPGFIAECGAVDMAEEVMSSGGWRKLARVQELREDCRRLRGV
ncbi:MAG: allophanate hydrolase-related protein [Verrucomicrobiota bacterium JB025]